jgi:multidrug resistance efflux pump
MIFNRLLAWGSVIGAVLLLVYATRLILNNTPTRPQAAARVMPPTQPRLAREVSFAKDDKSERSSEIAASQPNSDGKQRYIGGIGIVEPAGEAVSIGTQVPGLVTEVSVRPGDRVKKGDPLFVLDRRAAEASLAIAESNQQAAVAKLKELEGQISPTRSKLAASSALLKQAQADQANANQQYIRARQLAASSSISDEEVEARRLAYELSSAKVAEAEARVSEAKANLELLDGPTLDVQRAAIAQASANVTLARTNIDLLTIRAPLDATVLQVKVRVGEFAPAAVLTNALMVLGVTDPLHVRVEIDESEIPRLQMGSAAYAAVRGRADQQVALTFVRAEPFVVPKRSLSGGVSERVDTRVLELIYSVSPKQLQATVGQQVDVFIEE